MRRDFHLFLPTAICLLASQPAFAITQPARLPQGRPAQPAMAAVVPPLGTKEAPASPQITNNELPITYDRYAVIETRMPFGDESAAAALAAAAAVASQPVAESFTKILKMCAITRNRFNGKIQVGIVNTLTKKNYFLYEGDAEDGMELVKADFENEKALLRKGGEEVWMDMTAIVSSVMPTGPAAGRIPGMRIPPASQGGADSVAIPADGGQPSPQLVSESQRKTSSRQFGRGRSRESGESAPQVGVGGVPSVTPSTTPTQPAKPQMTGEALKEHLKNYQMDLIRAGGTKGPPLPMALTPEMDAKLVEEGVLPKVE